MSKKKGSQVTERGSDYTHSIDNIGKSAIQIPQAEPLSGEAD